MTNHRRFTPEEDAVILAGYSSTLIRDMAVELGRDVAVVQQRIYSLIKAGRLDPLTRCYQRPWSKSDEEDLKGWWGYLSLRRIARNLGRSEASVKLKGKRLGLYGTVRRGVYSARETGRIFGVDVKTVTHIWMASGALPGVKRSTIGAGKHRRWRITFDDIERFIRAEIGRYDYHRIAPGTYWREIAEEAQRPYLTAAQAARKLGVCRETVLRHCRNGWLPAIRVQGAITGTPEGEWRIRVSDLGLFQTRKPDAVGNRYLANARKRQQVAA